mmetsp:Transcript_69875/g.164417  ORF Transcript_69875/g.164417 Transcript_69875/m.164417 type:complete len:214 (+) Transcript_69875:859-1500(+)
MGTQMGCHRGSHVAALHRPTHSPRTPQTTSTEGACCGGGLCSDMASQPRGNVVGGAVDQRRQRQRGQDMLPDKRSRRISTETTGCVRRARRTRLCEMADRHPRSLQDTHARHRAALSHRRGREGHHARGPRLPPPHGRHLHLQHAELRRRSGVQAALPSSRLHHTVFLCGLVVLLLHRHILRRSVHDCSPGLSRLANGGHKKESALQQVQTRP